ncbi:MAG: hypothetical protein KAV87_45845, partial [Desulfobacteraceae bacterium]|nr:hypothetical protein [Desulfobacteraceae bacterium]
PFDAMLNALEQNMTVGSYPSDPLPAKNLQDGIDGLGRPLGDAEADIENGPPVRPENGMDDLLTQLEDSIENSSPIPLEPEMPDMHPESCGITDDKFSQPQSSGRDAPPLPYYIEDSQQPAPLHAPPYRQAGRIGRRGGGSFSGTQPGRRDETYCPIEKRIVTPDFCEDRDCKYYRGEDSDSDGDWHCAYYDEEEP